jgi:hypothetical protein
MERFRHHLRVFLISFTWLIFMSLLLWSFLP